MNVWAEVPIRKELQLPSIFAEGLDQICEDLIDHYEKHKFYNCVNLDENSRSNIMDDAHLRIMRTATANNREVKFQNGSVIKQKDVQ